MIEEIGRVLNGPTVGGPGVPAEVETQIVLFEPAGTRNTGTEENERTFRPDWV